MNNYTKKTLGEDIYSGSAAFGKISAVISAIFISLLTIVFVALGIYVIKQSDRMKSIEGTVVGNSICDSVLSSDNKTTYKCTTYVTYTVDGILYEKKYLDTNQVSYNDNQPIVIWYNPTKPNEPQGKPASKSIGYLIIGISVIILISSWVWVFITRRSKFAAAAGGASAAINLIRR